MDVCISKNINKIIKEKKKDIFNMLYSLLQLTEEQDSTYLCVGMFMFVSLSTIKRLSVSLYVSQFVCISLKHCQIYGLLVWVICS